MNESLNLFIEYLQIEKNYSHYTIENYQRDIEEFFMFIEEQGINDLTAVEYFDVRFYLTSCMIRNLSKRTVSRKISCLAAFINF